MRSTLDLAAGNLGQHLAVLEKAGLVEMEKGYEGKRGHTWVHLTHAGESVSRRSFRGPGAAAVPVGHTAVLAGNHVCPVPITVR
ncbi:transcriptional regulator [Streptomyces sp. NPDC021080]|uniref:transcriptional regulator n=1 Tax=Streptomyces sp. NPDC021080 TaxID=3365110 RepID=UPI003791C706